MINIIENLNNVFGVHKAYAGSLGNSLGTAIETLTKSGQTVTDEASLVQTIVNIAIPVSVICVVVLGVYGGYILMSSQGNPDKLQEGKEVITNAIIGFVVILVCTGILLLISNITGLGLYAN